MAPSKVILLACGSFNPPTNMHLRMFELARDNLNQLGQYSVIGGIISPVHDAYGKKELIPATYRCEMLKLAVKTSDWIQISDWECTQECWSRTRRVLQYHQNLLNSILNDQTDSPNNNQILDLENGFNYSSWITNDIRNTQGPVLIKLLCGADLLESFATPGLWTDEDIETIIGQHGLVVVTRHGADPRRFIYESDMLTKYQHNINIVTEWITNDVSSTKVRRALRRQESVKYLLEDTVIEFIHKHGLYGTAKKNDFKYEANLNNQLQAPINTYMLTPSPSDVNMMSASSSGNDIFLNLNPIDDQNLAEVDSSPNKNTVPQIFQSTAEIKLSSKVERNQSKMFQYPGQAVQVVPTESDKTLESPGNKKKVGFSECDKVREEATPKQVPEMKQGSLPDVSDSKNIRGTRKLSKKYSKSSDVKKTIKADSEREDKTSERGSLVLRRSQSDAVMSRKGDNGETVSVKIQFTKDGIKVISDKESIV